MNHNEFQDNHRGESPDLPLIQPNPGASASLRAAIVGGGDDCYQLLRILQENRPASLRIRILGVWDRDPEEPGIRYAKTLGIFTPPSIHDLFDLDGLNLIIELTADREVSEQIMRQKPVGVSLIDHVGVSFLWHILAMEEEKKRLERIHEKERERQRQHTRLILDSLPYRVMVVNMDLTVDTVNQTFLKDFGVEYPDVIGRYCYQARYSLDRPCHECGKACYLEEVKREGRVISTIHEYHTEEGEERYDVITVSPILNEKGEIVQLLEASRDVTQRIRLEKEVQRSNAFFQSVIQSTVDGIVVVDRKGKVLIFNEGMERLTGYSAGEMVDSGHLSSFYDIEVARENMKKMRSDRHGPPGKLNPVTMSLTNTAGEKIPVTLSASIITMNGEEVGSVGVFTDMREILQMRKELEDAHLQLVQSEKVASIGRMAAGVAHEINNPLSGILIYAELLQENLKEPEHMPDVEEIVNQTLRCKKIVSDLLQFSRQSIGKASAFTLDELITTCLDLLVNQAIFHDIQVRKSIQPHMPQMVGDQGQLQQVITNLFINAADAMEGKGSLEIQAEYDPERSVFIIRVADTGPGIPEGIRDQIFDMFFTTKPPGKGTGLGLSISQNIIKLHGGSLSYECPPEGGTIFTIEIPRTQEDTVSEGSVFVDLDD
jgi:PAS domain S-box-containing protein